MAVRCLLLDHPLSQYIAPEMDREWLASKLTSSRRAIDWVCQYCNRTFGRSIRTVIQLGRSRCIDCRYNEMADDMRSAAQEAAGLFADVHPELLDEWHESNSLSPTELSARDRDTWVLWKCRVCSHEWHMTTAMRDEGKGCHGCWGRAVTPLNSLVLNYPDLIKEWSPRNEKRPENYTRGSKLPVWWICASCGYEWQTSSRARTNGSGCAVCAGLVVTPETSLGARVPILVSEWHPKNDATAFQVSAGTRKKYLWRCQNCDNEWMATVLSRVWGSGCPKCALGRVSQAELSLKQALEHSLRETLEGSVFVRCDSGKSYYIDMVYRGRVGIEYDGEFWHRNQSKADRTRSAELQHHGYAMIHVRESGLESVNNQDVSFDPYTDELESVVEQVTMRIKEAIKNDE